MKVNISIDDVSPHPLSSIKVVDRCFELIKIFPDIKFSLFIPVSYWRTIKPGTTTEVPLRLDAFPDFCLAIKNLPKENFEICYHGFFHGIPGKSDNDEFKDLNREEAIEKFSNIFDIVKHASLEDTFKPIFRPPAWRMSPDAIKVAQEVGIRTLALSPKEYAKVTYAGAEANFPKVVYYNCNPPFDELTSSPSVEIVYHACEWDKNYMNIDLTQQLILWLKSQNDIEFKFIEGL